MLRYQHRLACKPQARVNCHLPPAAVRGDLSLSTARLDFDRNNAWNRRWAASRTFSGPCGCRARHFRRAANRFALPCKERTDPVPCLHTNQVRAQPVDECRSDRCFVVLGTCRQQALAPGLSPNRNVRHSSQTHLGQDRVKVNCQLLGGGVVVAEQNDLLAVRDLAFNGTCHGQHLGVHSHFFRSRLMRSRCFSTTTFSGSARCVTSFFSFCRTLSKCLQPTWNRGSLVAFVSLAPSWAKRSARSMRTINSSSSTVRRRDLDIPITSTTEGSSLTRQVINSMAHNEHFKCVGRRFSLCSQLCRHNFRASRSNSRYRDR